MPGQRTLTNSILIQAPPARILPFLTQPEAFARLNPLVTKVELSQTEPGVFFVYDRLTLLGLAFEVRYRAHLVSVENGIDTQAWSSPNVHIFNRIRCQPVEGATRVDENYTISAPSLLLNYVAQTAGKAHVELLANLKRKAEAK